MDMTTCAQCGGPMLAFSNGHDRVVCSYSCNGKRNRALQLARQAEVDDAAVWRLTHGQRVTSTHAERVEATRLLFAAGRSYAQTAAALHVTNRSVARYAAALKHRKDAA